MAVHLKKPDKYTVNISARTNKMKYVGKDREPAKRNFVVKIQIPFDDTAAQMWNNMFGDK